MANDTHMLIRFAGPLAVAVALASPLIALAQPEPSAAPKSTVKSTTIGGGAGGSGSRDRDRERDRPMTDEYVATAIEVLKEIQPELGQQLETLAARDPEEVRRSIGRLSPRTRWLVYTKMHDPEEYAVKAAEQRLQVQATELAHRIRSADEKTAAMLKPELEAVLHKHFEARARVLEHDLAALERRIQRMRDDLTMQRQQKQTIIADRLSQLLTDGYLYSGFGNRDRDGFRGPTGEGKDSKFKRSGGSGNGANGTPRE